MSGRSPSGVASLRARFEQNADPESLTPSRGRSPAGSVTSDTSRPLSKVRTSFVSVGEPSGHMGDLLSGKEAGKPIAGDGAVEGSEAKEPSKSNGTGPTSAPKHIDGYSNKASEDQDAPNPSMANPEKPAESNPKSSLAAADLGKPTAGEQDTADSTVPPDRNKKLTASGGESVTKDSPDLGSILKGSAFEKEEAKKEAAAQKLATSAAPKPARQAEGDSKIHAAPRSTAAVKPAPSMDKAANGKPKESQAIQSKAEAKPASEQRAAPKTQEHPKATASVDPKPPKKEPEKKEVPIKAVPSASNAPDNLNKAPKTNRALSATTGTIAVAAAPKREAIPKKPPPSKEPLKAAPKEAKPSTTLPAHKPSRPTETSGSSSSKAAPSTAPAASKPAAKKAVYPTSPPTSGTGFVKPKPRSPTRPVNLPAHLTAQTAASAAKYGDDSHVEPHKDQPTGNAQPAGARAPTHPPSQQRKPPRASMPAAGSSKLAEKEKSKPRMSVAGGNAPGGGSSSSFLERMMRPTQSSAQKTHERAAEPGKNSPPRKVSGSGITSRNVSGAGPKTVTGASTHRPDQHARNDGGHGEGREKHGGGGGSAKSGVGSGSGGERSAGKGKEPVVSAEASAAAADTEAPLSEVKPASAREPEAEQGNLASASGGTEETAKDETITPAAGPN